MSTIDEIKTRIDIVDLVSETVQLRRTGKNYTGFCPFHPNQRTPAFVVFPDTGTWRCFGQCNEGGDIFRFIMKKEGWDFPETLRHLAEKAGVQLTPITPEQQDVAEEHDNLRRLLEDAVVFYRHQLMNTPAGRLALDYLHKKRGLREDTLESFGIGYAQPGWETGLQYFLSRGVRISDLLAAGLVTERQTEGKGDRLDDAGVYDRFRNRIMIPIRDGRGRMAGFGARILDPDDIPKFLNSPQTPVFDKGKILYGLDRARKAIRLEDQAVIVEGYLDVITLHQAGFENVVSPMGTALSEHQLFLLKRFSRKIVLALDPDTAGAKATMRGLQIARQAMDRTQDPIFDAHGLLGHEARLQADIRVTTLPEGLDPDEVVNRSPEEWKTIVENARPIVIHVMESLAEGRDLEDPKTKNEIAAQVIPLIEDVPSPIERDAYRQRLARLLRIDERVLGEVTLKPSRRGISGGQARKPSGQGHINELNQTSPVSSYALEAYCLGILLRKPALLYQVDRRLQQEGLNRLSVEDFDHEAHQTIMRVFQDSIDQDLVEPQNYVFNSLSLAMMDLADDLLARTTQLDSNEERVLEDLMRGLLNLRRRRINQEIEFRKFSFEDLKDQGDSDSTQQSQYMVQLAKALLSIDRARAKYTSRAQLMRQ